LKKKDDRPVVIVGGILRHNRGTGFKITFNNVKLSRKYKDMIIWILKDDKFNVRVERGYHDKKERE